MKKILIGIVLIMMLVAAYFLGKCDKPAISVLHGTGQASESVSATDSTESSDLRLVSKKTSQPLPASNMPLAQIYVGLQHRADAGDGKAACRLAIELIRCNQALAMSKIVAMSTGAPNLGKSDDELQDDNATDELHLGFMEKVQNCGNLSDKQLKMTHRYLRQAALASEPDAMIAYADGMGIVNEGNFAFVRSENLDAWRREALPIAENALRHGIPEAIFLFNNGYSEDFSLFSGLIENDPYRAETMRLLRLRIEGKAFSAATTLNASDYQRALSESESMFKNYFQGLVNPKASFMRRLISANTTGKEAAAPCE
ncbi:MAG: hypothetical protein ABI644_03650 [Arenimonas sp.]